MSPRNPFATYLRPAMAREVFRRSRRTPSRLMSSNPRPFTFHIGASWAGKPTGPGHRPKVPFPSNSIVGAWRDHTLLRPKTVRSDDAGEDFFYVQEVTTFFFITLQAEIVPR
jgi:protein phosphatase PTC7